MALKINATLQFTSYEVKNDGISLGFTCFDPGAGEANDYTVFVSDTELSGISNLSQFRTLVLSKLQRKYRAQGIASKLDSLIGQEVTI